MISSPGKSQRFVHDTAMRSISSMENNLIFWPGRDRQYLVCRVSKAQDIVRGHWKISCLNRDFWQDGAGTWECVEYCQHGLLGWPYTLLSESTIQWKFSQQNNLCAERSSRFKNVAEVTNSIKTVVNINSYACARHDQCSACPLCLKIIPLNMYCTANNLSSWCCLDNGEGQNSHLEAFIVTRRDKDAKKGLSAGDVIKRAGVTNTKRIAKEILWAGGGSC